MESLRKQHGGVVLVGDHMGDWGQGQVREPTAQGEEGGLHCCDRKAQGGLEQGRDTVRCVF